MATEQERLNKGIGQTELKVGQFEKMPSLELSEFLGRILEGTGSRMGTDNREEKSW